MESVSVGRQTCARGLKYNKPRTVIQQSYIHCTFSLLFFQFVVQVDFNNICFRPEVRWIFSIVILTFLSDTTCCCCCANIPAIQNKARISLKISNYFWTIFENKILNVEQNLYKTFTLVMFLNCDIFSLFLSR